MTVLIFDNFEIAQAASDQINSNMGCPYTLDDGYFRDDWAKISKKYEANLWGYARPPEEFMQNVSGWIDELPNFPADWYQIEGLNTL